MFRDDYLDEFIIPRIVEKEKLWHYLKFETLKLHREFDELMLPDNISIAGKSWDNFVKI